MGQVIISGVAPQMKAPFAVPSNFSDATWEQIIDACQKNAVPDTWLVGDQKTMTINGTNYLIDIIGKNHDDYADGSGKAPLTFQMHDVYGTTYQMNSSSTNVGGWTSCDMRTTYLSSIFNFLQTEIQTGIKEVNKLTSAGNTSSTINTTSDKLFLLSEIEIFGSTTFSKSGEGSQYDYYKAGNSKVKNFITSACDWWERAPHGGHTGGFGYVKSDGTAFASDANAARGVSFAFCF